MRRSTPSTGLFLAAWAFLSFIVVIDAESQVQRSGRDIEVLEVLAKDLPPLLGRPVDSIRLMVTSSNHLIPIPFQIDERGADGAYLFRTSHPDLEDEDHGHFDLNDEFVFMARDLGDRLPDERISDKHLLAEMEVTDPLDGSRGWCYVTTREFSPGLSSKDYVVYDPRADRILTRNYRIGFSKEAPISYSDTTVTTQGGGNNTRINERVITRMKATFLRVFKLTRNEKDFRSKRKGYIDGPVRIIKRVGNSMRHVFGIYGPEVVVDYTFYFSIRQV